MRFTQAVIPVCTLSAAFALAAAPAAGQATNDVPEGKSGTTAMAIAFFVPGGGHLYAGEPIRGATMLVASTGIAAAALIMSNTINVDYTCEVRDCLDESQNPNYAMLGVGLGVAGAVWLYSFLDAPRAAGRANQRAVARTGLLDAIGVPEWVGVEPVALRTGGTVAPGLGIRLDF
jgi:hypothetical protein